MRGTEEKENKDDNSAVFGWDGRK